MGTENQQPDSRTDATTTAIGLLPLSIERDCDGCGEADATFDDIGIAGDTMAFIHCECGHVIEMDKQTVIEEYTEP